MNVFRYALLIVCFLLSFSDNSVASYYQIVFEEGSYRFDPKKPYEDLSNKYLAKCQLLMDGSLIEDDIRCSTLPDSVFLYNIWHETHNETPSDEEIRNIYNDWDSNIVPIFENGEKEHEHIPDQIDTLPYNNLYGLYYTSKSVVSIPILWSGEYRFDIGLHKDRDTNFSYTEFRKEYPPIKLTNALKRDGFHLIDRTIETALDFNVEEFNNDFTIERLCQALKTDKLTLKECTINAINNLLTEHDVYNKIINAKQDKKPSNELKESIAAYDEEKCELILKMVNRLAVNEYHPQETPGDSMNIKKLNELLIDNLNKFLKEVDLYDKLSKMKPNKLESLERLKLEYLNRLRYEYQRLAEEQLTKLINEETEMQSGTIPSKKWFENLEKDDKREISLRTLNRQLLEDFYPKTPKIRYHGTPYVPRLLGSSDLSKPYDGREATNNTDGTWITTINKNRAQRMLSIAQGINIHDGRINNDYKDSEGCLTIHPVDWERFIKKLPDPKSWGKNGHQGGVKIIRKVHDDHISSALLTTHSILKASTAPTIDGNLVEYALADHISFSPQFGGNTVTVRTVWNSEALYVGINVTDSELNASVTTRDGSVWNEDAIEWFIDTYYDRGSLDPNSPYMRPDDYHGIVNLINGIYDSQGTVSGTPTSTWNGSWQSAVNLNGTNNNNSDTDSGYTIEIRIPWTSIGYSTPPFADTIVGMSFAIDDKDSSSFSSLMWPNLLVANQNASNWQKVTLSGSFAVVDSTPPAPPMALMIN